MIYIKYISVILGVVVGIILSIWALDRDLPSQNVKSVILNPEVIAGGNVIQDIAVERVRICNITVTRLLYDSDGTRFLLPSLYIRYPGTIGSDKYNQEITIPNSVTKGPARLRVITEWMCNPVHYLFPIRSVVDYNLKIV